MSIVSDPNPEPQPPTPLPDERDAYQALELGDVDGRVSAACGNPDHPTWLRKPDDTRACPWCEVARLQARVVELEADSALLGALCAAGVDNWEGYDDAVAEAGDR